MNYKTKSLREHQAVRRTYEQTFSCKFVDKISERNYYSEKFDGVTVCALAQTKRNTKTLNRQ